ncbi:MAG: hypothetical protein NTW86_32780, partial [Candidatus Sumerlaeota bacterium]|nr:hypothetical protein [Candidatus Sumerlaeota bacterium]
MNRARLRTVVFLLFVMPALAAAAAQFREADGQLEVQTPALRLVVRHGSIVECDNALTGQRLCSPDAGPSPAEESRSGLLFEDGEAVSADERAKTAVAISPTEAATTTTLTGG